MKIIFLGAPGAGKGTQAEVVSKRFAIPAISTGAIIRAAIAMKTPTGVKAKEFIEKVKAECIGKEVIKSVTPGQQVVKIIQLNLLPTKTSVHRELSLQLVDPE